MTPAPQGPDTVIRTAEFEITTCQAGAFQKFILRGRFNEDMLGVLQRQVLLPVGSVAIDAGALSGITMPLARALYYASQALRGQGQALVLINPPESLRGFLKILGADGRVPILLSDAQLPAKPADAAKASEKLERELEAIRREMERNVLWQFVDREFCWVCPFCGGLREDVRIPSRVNIPQLAVERAWRHLNIECRRYVPAQPRCLPREDLEARVRKSNEAKLAASRERVEALQTRVERLQEKAQWAAQVEKGVKVAASRQRKLLPARPPDVPGCEISFVYRPAEEISGDFFDFVEMGDGRSAFVIGDVSGHGIEAGILVGMTKKVLSIRLKELGDPVAAVCRTNADIMPDLDRKSFVTAVVAVYDPAGRELLCVRAGHNPPILHNPLRGHDCLRFMKGGLMLGMAPPRVFDAQLEAEKISVRPGDVLLFYTDGLEEGKNQAGEEFGLARIVEGLKAERDKPGAYLLGALFYEFDRFAGTTTHEDDLTALCVKFK